MKGETLGVRGTWRDEGDWRDGVSWSGLFHLSGLFGLSRWPDRQTHQANQKNQMDKRDERGGQALGGVRAFPLFSSSNGVGKIGGTGPK